MRNFFIATVILLISLSGYSKNKGIDSCPHELEIVKANIKIVELEKENAILKAKLETFISENDKKIGLLSWPLGAIITLLVLIYGFGAFRSTVLAKQEARKAFKEDFESIKEKIDTLRTEAEKELEIIKTVKSIAVENNSLKE